MNPAKHFTMRKFFTLLFLIASLPVWAQQYNNEWINYSQTYYKFKVGSSGMYRIPKSVLDSAGIGGTSVQFFELWRNGRLVRIYPSVPSGALPANGYLEFWGEANDGEADNPLYRDSLYQHSKSVSLLTDTVAYFLSVNSSQAGLFHTDITNNVASNVLPVEPYFMHTAETHFRNRMNLGFAAVVGEYVYSSAYDRGEFWSSGEIRPGTPLSHSLTNLYVNNTAPSSTLKFGSSGNALNTRSVGVAINATNVGTFVMDYFNDLHTTVPFSTALINSGNATLQFSNNSGISTDRMVISYYEITYPSLFNFNNSKNFKFQLAGKSAGYYLEITNFNYGANPPVLYNLTSGQRFIGDISTPGTVKFAIPGSTSDNQFVLVNSEAGNINTVNSVVTRNFIRYSDPANQGKYLIITHPSLYVGSHGNNPIQDYKNYRASAAGGAHSVQVVDINELVDQFAFGIKKHPLSVKNFLRYCRNTFVQKPNNAFIIGHGMAYNEYRINEFRSDIERLNLIPSFGNPASDNMLSSDDATTPIAGTPIGRLSVVSGAEIESYLEKIKEYETTQKTAPNTVAGRAWMKNIVHVTGSSEPFLGTVLCNYMGSYKQIIEDTLFGGKVYTFCKTSTNPVEQLSSDRIQHLFEEGISVLTYFGHSSSTTLEFNLDNPDAYNNKGKYPIFFVNGCNAGNFFTYFPQRLLVNETLSEKFVLAKQRGSIAFVASTHFGIVNYLNLFLHHLYTFLGETGYGRTLGELNKTSLGNMVNAAGPFDYYARFHAEQITLHGDPAILPNAQAKPDYVIEEPQITINPSFISIAENTFKLKVNMMNIGKAIDDSIVVEIKHTYPNGTSDNIFRGKIRGIKYTDSLIFNVPINAVRDKGLNKIKVTLDADVQVDEITKVNNTAVKEIYIFEDEARPVYPYNFAIINNATQHLFASTANPFASQKNYTFEIDTTEFFNSSLKVTKTITSSGGVMEFIPGITYRDSTIYHWRVALNPTAGDYLWNGFSFMYKSDSTDGFNQSNFYQHKKSTLDRLNVDSTSHEWVYGQHTNNVFMRNGVFPTAANQAGDFAVSVNGSSDILSVCGVSNIVFNVFDPVTFKPWFNANTGGSQFGSDVVCGNTRRFNFQFNILDTNKRRKILEFMDMIPDGHFVVVKNFSGTDPASNTYASTWMGDTSYLGTDNSMYHRLITQGFTGIDSFNRPRAFIFLYRKNRQVDFIPKFVFSTGINDRITMSVDCLSPDTLGFITSPVFGPASKWKEVIWRGSSKETPSNDNPTIDVIGIDTNKIETILYKLDKGTQNFDISSLDAGKYPYMKLNMRNVDSISLSPYQLTYWRVYYTPVQEGALAPNLFLSTKDTLEIGETLKFGVAFKNVSKTPFDSIAVKIIILDKNNVPQPLNIGKQKPLISGDTAMVRFDIESKNYPGMNTLFVDINPDNDQPEQYHYNNFLYRNFYVKSDLINPLLDVTFDGVHILNRDIVSARPHIQIKLKDDAKYLLLNDTALSSVLIRNPDGTSRTYYFDNDTLRFTPASSGADNTATIDFYPAFTNQYNAEGDEYELIVKGKDRSGNKAGEIEYRVTFKIITKPMISNLLNYPNPFSTSTAFVFTLTGSEIPHNMKIQILTVTGKIVREITKDELGPIRIGRNITEFKWDGTDQYGQKLANGVYLYRFVTTLNGRQMDKYKANGDNTERFFNNGYGKMYLMR
jgi:hypothetical protein